jgi:GTP-binding protein
VTGEARQRLRLEYAGSAEALGDAPPAALPEIAIAGRSNVGKSSLLNTIGDDRSLARVSRTPGRTQRLHFFDCPGESFRLVDLPGYGWARAARTERERWGRGIEQFLAGRAALVALVLLVDVRRDPTEDELAIERFAAERGLVLLRVATKVDKLGRTERARRLRALEQAMPGGWIPFSSLRGEGRETLIEALSRVRRANEG